MRWDEWCKTVGGAAVGTLAAAMMLLQGCEGCQTAADDDGDDDDGQHCLDEGATSCIDGSFYECVDGSWDLVEECVNYCDPDDGCLYCNPGQAYCEGDRAMQCADDGLGAELIMDCAEWDVECVDGECVFDDPCLEAQAWESNVGCQYWAADLDNSENFLDDAAAGKFAVAVANIGQNGSAHVTVTVNDAPQGEPLDLREIDSAEVGEGYMEIFELPRRDVDGHSMMDNVDDGPQSWLSSRAFRIDSDVPIVAYQFNTLDQQFSNDASLLLPTYGLGGDHLVVTYSPANPVDGAMSPRNRTYVTIMGVWEDTHVEVTPSYDIFYGQGDCDDGYKWTYPTAAESCDGIDNNCDGELGEEEVDGDGDGHMMCAFDCDDTDPTVYPGAPELCDGIDNNCDKTVGDDNDWDGDGYTPCQLDCNDWYSSIYPGAPEACNGKDDDCDGVVPADELDADGDGMTPCEGDCDDTDPEIYLGAPNQCGGVDYDCDGVVDESNEDLDGDGYSPCDGDCDDTDDTVYPGATELCNGLDDDCDGAPDADEVDADGDGSLACEDCDDGDDTVYPGGPELCDGLDNDCDGEIHETGDGDGDGWPPCTGVPAIHGEVAIDAGTTQQFTIGPFDVLNLETTFATLWPPQNLEAPDLTGTWISADEPIAVFTGTDMSMIVAPNNDPEYDPCCAEHIEQQVIPSKSMAEDYVVTRSAIRNEENPEMDGYRIIAYADGTSVSTTLPTPNDQFLLDAGEYAEFFTNHGFVVDADGPLHVAQFLTVGTDAGGVGDSALMYVPALAQRRNVYLFVTGEGFSENHATISAPSGVGVTLDGVEVGPPQCSGPWADGELDGVVYESYSCPIADGVHVAHSGESVDAPGEVFGVYVYGYYYAGSYAYPAGSDLRVTNELSPN